MLTLSRRHLFRLPPAGERGDAVLVLVFLRGGADGLALVPPYADDDYHRLRPSLAHAAPDDRRAAADARTITLDDRFGLHPALAPLLPLYREGELAIVHAVGSDDQTRSHFEAQDRMEHGGADGSGWLARLARAWLGHAPAGLSTVAVGRAIPESLRGAPQVGVLESAAEHRLDLDDPAYATSLGALYAGADALAAAGRDALDTMARLEALAGSPVPANGAAYPDDIFGRRLAEVARLVRARLGLRIACVDVDGWDTHFVQGETLAERARVLASGLAAFHADLGDMRDITVLAVTEFGRRAYENGSLGTDHGRASALFALGAGVRGGRVHGHFPGLGPDDLEEPGDLRVTTDHRSVLAAWARARTGIDDAGLLFRGFTPEPLDLFQPT